MENPAILQLPLVVAVFGVSLWGARAVPRGTRFPIRFGGAAGFQTFIGKTPALVLWPAMAVFVAAGASVVDDDSPSIALLGVVALAILLIGQIASVRKAAGPGGIS